MQQTTASVLEVPAASEERREARTELAEMARGRFGAIPADLLADHVLALDTRADWPVLREAMEALRRRWKFAERDGLRLARRPDRGHLGEYATRRSGMRDGRDPSHRPYRTLLERLDPPHGSCGCPDFRRSSLGLCKHLLVVLDSLARKPRAWRHALGKATADHNPRITWDPLRPLVGAHDWLERVRLVPAGVAPSRLPAVARSFSPGVGADWVLRSAHPQDPKRRLALVRQLAAFARGRDPALEARLAEEEAELARIARLAEHGARLRAQLSKLSRRLYPYQREGVLRFLARGRLLLADDMGLGKTMQAIAAAHALHGAGLVQRGLLVVPAPLKHQWLLEWRATSDAPIEVVDGSRAERERVYGRTRRGFLVANYEQLLRDLDLVQAWKPELGVLDEAQRIKNWAAKTSHSVKSLRPEYRLVLTGTPMENRLDELASIVEWVDDHALEPKWRLAPLHAVRADGKREIVGARHLDTLRARLAPCTVRRVRHEVLDQLPKRTDTTLAIDLTPSQLASHAEFDKPIASLLKRAAQRPLTQEEFLKLMRLFLCQRQVCNGLALADFGEVWPAISRQTPTERLLATLDSPKLSELRALVEGLCLDQGRKVVVFSQWRRMLQLAGWAVSDLLARNGLRAAHFTGHEGGKRRVQNLVEFHDDPAVRILFATDAGGVGLNLQRAASACVLLELPWNPAVLEQRVGRIHRLGQEEPVQVYALVARGGIEERIASLVADKRALFRGLFDGGSDEVQFDRSGSFLEALRRATPDVPADADDAGEEDLDELLDPSGDEQGGEEAVDLDGEAPEARAGDQVPAPSETAGGNGTTSESPPEAVPSESEGSVRGAAGLDEHGVAVPRSPDGATLRQLLAGLSIERTPSGGLRIEAPPESAEVLALVLEGLANALRSGCAVQPERS
ncbi:MAG TPA: DEAD/DEAH box helicase [Planctomycetota bacterium]|nr:DEAD/DEAH box helicase [Planctomycetota bacterium]